MDATRARRTHDARRQKWYAIWRTVRFARVGSQTRPDAQLQLAMVANILPESSNEKRA